MTKSFYIGSIKIKNPFILAPLAGISNWPFRFLASEFGAAFGLTEMVSAVALSYKGPQTLKLLNQGSQKEEPFCVQLFGKDPSRIALAAQVAQEKGADIIDFNLACPARKVIRSGSGAALLNDLTLTKEILTTLSQAVDIPITIKTRVGFHHHQPTIFKLLDIAVKANIKAITLHPRSAEQAFGGEADWDLVGSLAEISPLPIIGSGDIKTGQQAVDKLNNYPIKAVMIGRAAKGQPWIFQDALDILENNEPKLLNKEERFKIALKHASLLGLAIGTTRAPFLLRSVLMWYTKGLKGATEFRRRLCQEENLNKQLLLLEECFLENEKQNI